MIEFCGQCGHGREGHGWRGTQSIGYHRFRESAPRILHENQRCRPEFAALVDALRAEFTRAEITAIADYIENPDSDSIPAAAVTLIDALILVFNEN